MKIIDCQQGTPEWHAARAGKVTASCISDVMAKIKTGEAAARRDYKATIVAEILTGTGQGDSYISPPMQCGMDQEPYARAAYEVAKSVLVDQVGFVLHPTIERAGMSPDGVVGGGLVEIKCPNTATHIQYLLAGKVPAQYQPQMLWQMACAESPWCDFVSFDPRLSPELQLFVVRFDRDEARIKEMEAEVALFLSEVDAMVAALKARG